MNKPHVLIKCGNSETKVPTIAVLLYANLTVI